MNITQDRNKLLEAFAKVLWERYAEPEIFLRDGPKDHAKSCVFYYARTSMKKFLGLSNREFKESFPQFNSGTAHAYINKRIKNGTWKISCDTRCQALANVFVNRNKQLFEEIFDMNRRPVLKQAFIAETTRASKKPVDRR